MVSFSISLTEQKYAGVSRHALVVGTDPLNAQFHLV